MWPFSKPTIEDLQSKAYLVFTEFGTKAMIPREQRLWQKFPDVDRTTIKIWIGEFKSIEREMSKYVGSSTEFDGKAVKLHLRGRFAFMDERALERAAYLAWFSSIW